MDATNSFTYVHWSGDQWKAEIVKAFFTGNPTPDIQFRHSRHYADGSWREIHYEKFIDYTSDALTHWRATIQYIPTTNSFLFTHCKDGGAGCHDDVIMNMLEWSGAKKQLRLENCTLGDFQSNLAIISVDTIILAPPPVPPGPIPTGMGMVSLGWSSKTCGCGVGPGPATGFEQYLYNSTPFTYQVTVTETNISTSSTNHSDYMIKPGGEIYVGCSQDNACNWIEYKINTCIRV